MPVTELDRAPGTAALYRRAALGLLPGGRRPAGLPDAELVLRDVAVDRARLARYDRVCGFGLTDELPATYPHVLAFGVAMRLMSASDFPFPVVGLVHVANHIEVRRPVDAAERLDLSVRAVDLRPHRRGRQFDVLATATVDGERVWSGRSTYLRVETAPPRHGADPAPPDSAPPDSGAGGAGPGGAAPADRTPPPASAVWRVAPRTGPDYAGVSGDHNPIHTSRLGARVFGFRRPIAHGMWSKARCLAALAGRLPAAYTVDVSFHRPVLLPATVAFSATPGWDFALHDARSGRPHLTGTIRA